MIKTILCCFAMICFSASAQAEGKRIVKWVDKHGVTHYGDQAPLPDSTNKTSELNKSGMAVKRVEQTATQHEAEKVSSEQNRRDSALLASYNSAEEIDIACDRNTRIDKSALESLGQKRTNLKDQQQKNATKMADLTKRKRPIPPQLVEDNQKYQTDIADTDKLIVTKQHDIDNIRKRYDNDKQRYLELKAQGYTLSNIRNATKAAP
jgi:MFS superfamily sulfate permease-like transporter